jgi:hypothetical protein
MCIDCTGAIMDERLEKALEFSNYRISLFQRKEDLKLNMANMLTHANNGGIFKIDPTLICFVKQLVDKKKTRAVLIDSNENPIELTDLKDFYDEIFNKYFEATNLYHIEYSKLKSSRTVSSLYDFIEEK